MVRAFAQHGADVIITSRKSEACQDLAAEIQERFGRKALAYACHLGHWDEIDGLVAAVYEEFGRVDVLVNNAGSSALYESLDSVTEQLFDSTIGLNLKGPFRLSALVGTRMAEGDGGSIINVSSIGSLRPEAYSVPYCAAKAGLNNLTLGFSRSLGPKVRVNGIICGAFFTDISKAWDMEEFQARAKANFSLGRGAQPKEIVGTALYLASDASSYTTGALISVDGGYY
jgi:NAD(P)-dependent dehydrogenase (short-subunit alcohol dehydrogenase family)